MGSSHVHRRFHSVPSDQRVINLFFFRIYKYTRLPGNARGPDSIVVWRAIRLGSKAKKRKKQHFGGLWGFEQFKLNNRYFLHRPTEDHDLIFFYYYMTPGKGKQ